MFWLVFLFVIVMAVAFLCRFLVAISRDKSWKASRSEADSPQTSIDKNSNRRRPAA